MSGFVLAPLPVEALESGCWQAEQWLACVSFAAPHALQNREEEALFTLLAISAPSHLRSLTQCVVHPATN